MGCPQCPDETEYTIEYDNGKLYIVPIRYGMGGGIGRCTQKYKTFVSTFTRSQAQNAITAMKVGETAVQTLGDLLAASTGAAGAVASIVLTKLGGESNYVRYLKNFIDSGKSRATMVFETHCENKGYMYGDPMYDYAIDSVRITY